MDSLVVITGFTMNFTPNTMVINTEKLPMVLLGTRLETQLPTIVSSSTGLTCNDNQTLRKIYIQRVYQYIIADVKPLKHDQSLSSCFAIL